MCVCVCHIECIDVLRQFFHHVSLAHGLSFSNCLFFQISQNPFTAKSFCNANHPDQAERRGNSYCPHHYGRCKLLLRPKKHRHEFRKVHIHGRKEPDPDLGIFHFDTAVAHMKEWPGQFAVYAPTNRPATNFCVSSLNHSTTAIAAVVGIPSFAESYPMNANGTFNMYYDANLDSWLQFVANRRSFLVDGGGGSSGL
jgi:hypothetical protein